MFGAHILVLQGIGQGERTGQYPLEFGGQVRLARSGAVHPGEGLDQLIDVVFDYLCGGPQLLENRDHQAVGLGEQGGHQVWCCDLLVSVLPGDILSPGQGLLGFDREFFRSYHISVHPFAYIFEGIQVVEMPYFPVLM